MLNRAVKVVYKYQGQQYKLTIVLGLFILFWALFDSVVTYISPVLIMEQGYSETVMGLIIGTSSLVGGIFDFILSKIIKKADFRRLFLLMMALCFIYPLALSQANSLILWLLAMSIWGIYYDLYGFAIFDYVGRHTKAALHAANFGIVQIFRSLAGVLGPLIVGLIIVDGIGLKVFAWQWLFLFIASAFLVVFIFLYNRKPTEIKVRQEKVKPFFLEFRLWKSLGKKLFPVLLLTLFIYVLQAFFWTLAPIFSTSHHWGGLLIAAFTLPNLIFGWYVGPVTKIFGKKRTAFFSLLIGSTILAGFALMQNHWWVMFLIFIAACFFSFTLPAIEGAYADYISESPKVETEIVGLEDFAFNVGYVLGPILAGLLADIFDIARAFSIIGLVGIMVSLFLIKITPKEINIKLKDLV